MKKDIRTIIVLLVLIILLSGGIFFVLKTDIFSKDDDIVEKNNSKKDDNEKSNEEENKEDNEEKDEESKDEEKDNSEVEDKKEEQKEEQKKEETKKEDKTPVIEVPKVTPNLPNNKKEDNTTTTTNNNTNNNSSNNNNNENNSNNNASDNENNNQTNSNQNSEPLKPVVPTTKTLTCTYVERDEDGVFTHTVVGVFDTADNYINTYKETYVIDFSDTYEPFTDEARTELENIFKDSVIQELGDVASALTITTKSTNNIISLITSSDRDRLKTYSPDDFTPNGFFYYDNFRTTYINDGYTCN